MRRWTRCLSFVTLITVLLTGMGAASLPSGGTVREGIGTIHDPTHGTLVISQESQGLVIDWDSFSIGEGNSVRFDQALGRNAVALNRVVGNDPSEIFGNLTADGQIFLINPRGILFGSEAKVDVGGLVASTLSLSNEELLTDQPTFILERDAATVTNLGTIKAQEGGYVALIAPEVRNDGRVIAYLGTVAFGAGGKVTLDFSGERLVGLVVDEAVARASVANHGEILADGGLVVMSAEAHDALAHTTLNQDGIIRANSVAYQDGRVILSGGRSGVIQLGGTIDASGSDPGTTGGQVRIDGEQIEIADDAVIDVSAQQDGDGGQAIVKATESIQFDGLIFAQGGELGGHGGYVETSGRTLGVTGVVNAGGSEGDNGTWVLKTSDITVDKELSGIVDSLQLGTNVSIYSERADEHAGTIAVTESIVWDTDAHLSFTADEDIHVSALIGNTGNGGLTLRADAKGSGNGTAVFNDEGSVDFGSGQGTVEILYNVSDYRNPADYSPHVTGNLTAYMLVNTAEDLQLMDRNRSGIYALGRDINADETRAWDEGAGFMPIGSFGGLFDGRGHQISGLYVQRPEKRFVGLFGFVNSNGTVRNVTLDNVQMEGGIETAGLVGRNEGTIIGSHVLSGDIKGHARNVGGLAGISTGEVLYSSSGAKVSAPGEGRNVGGLVGQNDGRIHGSHSTGSVHSDDEITGGLAGLNTGEIVKSYSASHVLGTGRVGGLVGYNYRNPEVEGYAIISRSYSTGSVEGTSQIGGLLGQNAPKGRVLQSYSTASTLGTRQVGGLVGYNAGHVQETYSTGLVRAQGDDVSRIGGLIGQSVSNAPVLSSYWDMETSGRESSSGGVGIFTDDLQNESFWRLMTDWDVDIDGGQDKVWRIYDGHTAPLLKAFLRPITVKSNDDSRIYDATVYTDASYVVSKPDAILLGTADLSEAAVANAGTYQWSVKGFYSDQQGYDIVYIPGTLLITPRLITITADVQSKVYGDDDPEFTFTVGGAGLAVGEQFEDVFVGTLQRTSGEDVAAGPYAIFQGTLQSNSNYEITQFTGSHLTITPALLTVTVDDVEREFGKENPPFTVRYDGFAWDENETVLGGVLEVKTDAGVLSIPGEYTLTPGGLTSTNYDIVFKEGTLTIVLTPGRESDPGFKDVYTYVFRELPPVVFTHGDSEEEDD